MEIIVQRDTYTDRSTQGELLIDGEHFCWTLEPKKEQSRGKPYCIPAGKYQGLLQLSPHFGMVTPHLLDVPGFVDIEIHPGNFWTDTMGCTMVGYEKGTDFIGQSRPAFEDLMGKILTAFEITYLG